MGNECHSERDGIYNNDNDIIDIIDVRLDYNKLNKYLNDKNKPIITKKSNNVIETKPFKTFESGNKDKDKITFAINKVTISQDRIDTQNGGGHCYNMFTLHDKDKDNQYQCSDVNFKIEHGHVMNDDNKITFDNMSDIDKCFDDMEDNKSIINDKSIHSISLNLSNNKSNSSNIHQGRKSHKRNIQKRLTINFASRYNNSNKLVLAKEYVKIHGLDDFNIKKATAKKENIYNWFSNNKDKSRTESPVNKNETKKKDKVFQSKKILPLVLNTENEKDKSKSFIMNKSNNSSMIFSNSNHILKTNNDEHIINNNDEHNQNDISDNLSLKDYLINLNDINETNCNNIKQLEIQTIDGVSFNPPLIHNDVNTKNNDGNNNNNTTRTNNEIDFQIQEQENLFTYIQPNEKYPQTHRCFTSVNTKVDNNMDLFFKQDESKEKENHLKDEYYNKLSDVITINPENKFVFNKIDLEQNSNFEIIPLSKSINTDRPLIRKTKTFNPRIPTQSQIENQLKKSFIKKHKVSNFFFKNVKFYSELKKVINITEKIIYASRFCVLTETEFKCYKCKEDFVVMKTPLLLVKVTALQGVNLINMEKKETKGKRNKTHFGIKFYKKNNKTRKEDEVDVEFFGSSNANMIKQWVKEIKQVLTNESIIE